jgi:hypothetical protein
MEMRSGSLCCDWFDLVVLGPGASLLTKTMTQLVPLFLLAKISQESLRYSLACPASSLNTFEFYINYSSPFSFLEKKSF